MCDCHIKCFFVCSLIRPICERQGKLAIALNLLHLVSEKHEHTRISQLNIDTLITFDRKYAIFTE